MLIFLIRVYRWHIFLLKYMLRTLLYAASIISLSTPLNMTSWVFSKFLLFYYFYHDKQGFNKQYAQVSTIIPLGENCWTLIYFVVLIAIPKWPLERFWWIILTQIINENCYVWLEFNVIYLFILSQIYRK